MVKYVPYGSVRVSRMWLRILRAADKAEVKFHVTSGHRTMEEQQKLFNLNMVRAGVPKPGRPMTAVPSRTAPHIRLLLPNHAIDVNALDGGETRLQRWLEKQGAHPKNTVPGEAWHMELSLADFTRLYRKLAPKKKKRYAYRLGYRSLRKVVPTLSTKDAKALARDLAQAMVEYKITTARRATMFVAQIAHESAGFRYREEIASGAAYEGRRDLGNAYRGDGVRFKGRSYIQITGRNNYTAISKALGVDFVNNPKKLAEPKYAAKAAAWWWHAHGCNALADSGDFIAVTKRINGGTNGLASRQAYYARARSRAAYLIPKRRKP